MKGSFTVALDFKLRWWIYSMFSVYTHILGNTFVVWSRDVIIRFPTETALRQVAVWGFPKTTLKFINFLGGLTELRKAIMFVVTGYYSEKIDSNQPREETHGKESRRDQVGISSCPLLVKPWGQCFSPQWCGSTANQESSPEPWCSEILFGSHHCLLVRLTSASSLFGHSFFFFSHTHTVFYFYKR